MWSKKSLFGLIVSIPILLALLPVLIGSNALAPICGLEVAAAQENPCLAQEATISAQQVQILQLQATISAQLLQMLSLEQTLAARSSASVIVTPLIVEIVVTATPNPNASPSVLVVTATPSPETEDAEESTAEVTDETDVEPTFVLPPTVTGAQAAIVEVISAGDITAEGVVIRNTGGTLDITGWTLNDGQGNVFAFPEQLLFANAMITIYTRNGQNTPVALYWGKNAAVWGESGGVVILADADGNVQATLRVG